jgi:DNA invertase Pin-like site-specific DNA recombinase
MRLSREDGDKAESDSIINQQRLIDGFCAAHPEFQVVDHYADDGYTGTNFNRPAFQRLIHDIEAGRLDLVIVKDLSRFGRDYIDTGFYLERYFPSKGVRFIAINDHEDSINGPYNMLLPLKNVFNTQYAKDISEKVKSAFKTKQKQGEFIGAFASYGYLKDPERRNRLIVDPVAAQVVREIFRLAASGMGQIRIAKELNDKGVPCPSAYKRLMGMKYRNSRRLASTGYWTYATIHRILQNQMYLGDMVQSKAVRTAMHGKATSAGRSDWIIVPGTHEAIVSKELWDTVQAQMNRKSRGIDFQQNVGIFAGYLKCGDCGRALCKTTWKGRITYSCGSYRRYGSGVCSPHYIQQKDLEQILLEDLNKIIAAVDDLNQAVKDAHAEAAPPAREQEALRLTGALERIQRLKQSSYEDYRDGLLSREEFIRYKEDYDRQESTLSRQLDEVQMASNAPAQHPWAAQLLGLGRLEQLDRATIAQSVQEIRVFEGRRLEIDYLCSPDPAPVLPHSDITVGERGYPAAH